MPDFTSEKPKRQFWWLWLCLSIVWSAVVVDAFADPPVFLESVIIQNDAEELPGDESGYTAPCVGDWDGDGDHDLLIGTFFEGPLYQFNNVSERVHPQLELVGRMEADGEPISVPYEWCEGAYPQMADLDNDGDMDLLVGDSHGYITVFLRDDEGNLSDEGHLLVDDDEFDIGDRASPQTVDWDLDGDLDLIVGNVAGAIDLIINEGSAEEYDFTYVGALEANGEEIWLGSETSPAFSDLDGDGKRDLIIGSRFGELWFYPNTGEDDEPQFGEGIQLRELIAGEPTEIVTAGYSRPEIVDWDGDGDLDIVCGVFNPEIRLFRNPTNDTPVIAVDNDTLDFGEINAGVRRNLMLTIFNDGSADLEIFSVTIAGQYFRTNFGEEIAIEPGADFEFNVIFAPDAVGDFHAALTLTSNDPDNGELIVNLHGVARSKAVDDDLTDVIPTGFSLSPAYPNPFNATTRLSFGLPVNAAVLMQVVDLSGRVVQTLIDGNMSAGRYTTSFEAQNLQGGVYLIRMNAAGVNFTRKVVLIK